MKNLKKMVLFKKRRDVLRACADIRHIKDSKIEVKKIFYNALNNSRVLLKKAEDACNMANVEVLKKEAQEKNAQYGKAITEYEKVARSRKAARNAFSTAAEVDPYGAETKQAIALLDELTAACDAAYELKCNTYYAAKDAAAVVAATTAAEAAYDIAYEEAYKKRAELYDRKLRSYDPLFAYPGI